MRSAAGGLVTEAWNAPTSLENGKAGFRVQRMLRVVEHAHNIDMSETWSSRRYECVSACAPEIAQKCKKKKWQIINWQLAAYHGADAEQGVHKPNGHSCSSFLLSPN